jgi:TRAP-type C4-dicarboxylate transport system permease small subunit
VPWTGEIARLALVWLTFVLAGYLAAHDRHIAIQVVDYVLGGRALAAVKLFVDVVVLATCVVAMVAIAQLLAEDIGQVTPAAQLPLWIVNFVPLVGFALTTLRVIVLMLVRDLPVVSGRTEAGP